MTTKVWKSIKGRVARITRLDECGAPVFGACSVVVTAGFITVKWSHEYEEGDSITTKNAWGDLCVDDKDPDVLRFVPVAIEFCEVNPDVLDIIGGANPIVYGPDTIGASFGPQSNISAFGLEVWTKKAGQSSCNAGTPEWGYAVFAFNKNGKLDGDVTIENGALSMTLAAEAWGAPSDWGTGPHGDNPLKVATGFPVGDMWALVVTDVQPPDVTTGCDELVPPPDKAAVEPGDVFPSELTITAEDNAAAALLSGLGFVPDDPTPWANTSPGVGEFFTVGTHRFHWGHLGTAWAAGDAGDIANVVPGEFFQPEPTITAEDAPAAALLAGLGFVSDTAGAWSAGQYFSIGIYRFNWGGAAWDFGPA